MLSSRWHTFQTSAFYHMVMKTLKYQGFLQTVLSVVTTVLVIFSFVSAIFTNLKRVQDPRK